jgi:CRP/FNR family transcriptional regulator, anaerobic regulatory protein
MNDKSNTHSHQCKDNHESCISLVPIFNHLEKKQMDEIMTLIHSKSYKKWEDIYQSGNTSDALYIVRRGRVKIYRLSESGKEQILRILNPGDFTGELALFNESVHDAFASAIVETEVCMIKRADLQDLLLKYPNIAMKILAEFSNRLAQSETQATRFATESVEMRIALFLVESLDTISGVNEIVLPMSKKDLASYLGTTPETISRKLLDFENLGLIRQLSNKKIQILDVDGLLLI